MATIMIRNLDEVTKANLRIQATRHDLSMKEEARRSPRTVNATAPSEGLGTRLQQRFGALGGVELETSQLPDRAPPEFSERDE